MAGRGPLAGRVAVVTGGNGGLGLETAKGLLRTGSHVIVAARNPKRNAAAQQELRDEVPDASVEVVPLDLASLESVRSAARTILDGHDRVDVLVNNAGVMAVPEQRTADGFEMQLGVNHLGHFAFTALLLPALLRAESARVVTVTSTARLAARPLDSGNPHLEGRYGPWRAYGQSKLANYHFALGLDRKFREAGVSAASLTAHPGLSNTGLQARSVDASEGGLWQRFWHRLATTTGTPPSRGALSQLRAATDARARGGQLYTPRFGTGGAPVRRPVLRRIGLSKAIRELWEVSERETGVTLDVQAAMMET